MDFEEQPPGLHQDRLQLRDLELLPGSDWRVVAFLLCQGFGGRECAYPGSRKDACYR
jgi:hypothetical protein